MRGPRGASAMGLAVLFLAAAPAPETRWPAPPDPARMQYVESLDGRSRITDTGLAGRVLRLLLGLKMPFGSSRRALARPTGLYARNGILYVADPGARAILRYDLATRRATWLNAGRNDTLISPVSVAVSTDGRVFVADSAAGRVHILRGDGKVLGELRGDPEGLGRPSGMAIGEGRLYVADAGRHRVSVYGLDGSHIYTFGRRGTGAGEFNYPTYLWFEQKTRRLWVCDSGNFRIQALDGEGRPLAAVGESGDRPGFMARPKGLATDSDGNLHVADAALEALQILDRSGRLLLFVGQEGRGPGEFSLPGGVFIDEQDRVFVSDTFNGRVQVFQYFKEAAP